MDTHIDDPEYLLKHHAIIRQKPCLKRVYEDFYRKLLEPIRLIEGPIVELGSGGGFLKHILPEVITSDIVAGPGIDHVFSADHLPFQNGTVGAFLMVNVFHHIKDVARALGEMERCLKPGGKIVMIEPYNSSWGRFVYQHFHHETFDPGAGWVISGHGRMSDANGALPWIVFVRDRVEFVWRFPLLTIRSIQPHTPLRYLLSGGLSKPQLIPSVAYGPLFGLEKLLSPCSWWFSMFCTIEVEKKK